MKRIGPLSNVKPFWDHGADGYPTRVRLAMSDGHIVTFWREVQQPKPRFWNPIREIIGYPRQEEYQPRHLRRPAVLQHQPASEKIFRTHSITGKEQ